MTGTFLALRRMPGKNTQLLPLMARKLPLMGESRGEKDDSDRKGRKIAAHGERDSSMSRASLIRLVDQ